MFIRTQAAIGRLVDLALLRFEAQADALIEWRAKRMLPAALRVYGPDATYGVVEPTQVQTKAGLRMARAGENVQVATAPNHAMQPVNESAVIIYRAWKRTAGGFPIIQGKPIAIPAGQRAERVANMRKDLEQ